MAIDATTRVRTIVDTELEPSDRDVAHAAMLPSACYTSPEFFEFEKRALFATEWLCVGRESDVPNTGDYITVTIADEPLVVVRGADGRVRVLSSVCRHRGMVVTDPVPKPRAQWWDTEPNETAGNCGRAFRCPYHYWTYDLTGKLIGAPDMQATADFDKATVNLPSLKVETWNGFIFANLDEHAASLSPRLAPIDALIAAWNIGDMVSGEAEQLRGLPWNWKVMVENFVEFYHSDRLHNPICAFSRSDSYEQHDFEPTDATIVAAGRTTHADFGFNPTFKALFPPIPGLTEDERALAVFFLVPPTLAFGVNSDSAFYFLLNPTAVDRLDIKVAGLYPPAYRDLPRFEQLEALAALGIEYFNEQDFAAVASIQRGLRSKFAPRGRFSWQEEPITHFNRWLIHRYRAALAT
jgi:phenylpropionate dioxygenase-like ring-hydroxylating dioxygenase large terminal subunit